MRYYTKTVSRRKLDYKTGIYIVLFSIFTEKKNTHRLQEIISIYFSPVRFIDKLLSPAHVNCAVDATSSWRSGELHDIC